MAKAYQVMPDIEIISSYFPIPNTGFLAVNAFIIKAKEPVLVDTGMGIESREFMEALKSLIDPKDLKWVWITHDDADHTGSLKEVFEAAPNARLVANSLAVLRMSTAWPVPMDRVYWLNPGESIDVGDRKLTAVRPPLFDNPTTIGIYDDKSKAFFSADCFGAIVPSPVQNVEELKDEELSQGMISWAGADNPWIYMNKPEALSQALDSIRKMDPKIILSSHLPPVQGKNKQLLELLAKVPSSAPFVAPNQEALEQILAQMRGEN